MQNLNWRQPYYCQLWENVFLILPRGLMQWSENQLRNGNTTSQILLCGTTRNKYSRLQKSAAYIGTNVVRKTWERAYLKPIDKEFVNAEPEIQSSRLEQRRVELGIFRGENANPKSKSTLRMLTISRIIKICKDLLKILRISLKIRCVPRQTCGQGQDLI